MGRSPPLPVQLLLKPPSNQSIYIVTQSTSVRAMFSRFFTWFDECTLTMDYGLATSSADLRELPTAHFPDCNGEFCNVLSHLFSGATGSYRCLSELLTESSGQKVHVSSGPHTIVDNSLFVGKPKSTVHVGLLGSFWKHPIPPQIFSKWSDNRTLFYRQQVPSEEPVTRRSWKNFQPYTLTASLISLNCVQEIV